MDKFDVYWGALWVVMGFIPRFLISQSMACLDFFWKYLRIASENGQKSRIYYVKGAKTSPSLTVSIQVSDWAEIWYIASIYIYMFDP